MEKEYISGEEYQDRQHQRPRQSKQPRFVRLSIAILVAVVVMLLAFVGGWLGGARHQKSRDSELANSAESGPSLSQNSGGSNGSLLCTSGQACSNSGLSGGGPTICSGGTCTSGGAARITGTVTAVDASNITIKLSGGSTETFSITNTTGFSQGAGSGELKVYTNGDVQVGETVGVIPTSSGDMQAQIIIVNPPSGN